ncbi:MULTISPECIES: hypothetical protein [unclassified Serratia (in: enterobacteria)]|uniref:hypothetical protein n=1 Tax=unclassified Serratia (in: enterobacteria) TaxID=2647522 RepID=UPI000468AF19|nr:MULTISPECIES: hypothetical protein [unclassified Serratia (in: enterobacteria)]
MLKQYLVPINEDNKFHYHHMKGYLSALSMSLLGAMVYSIIDRVVNPNSPPDWFIHLLAIILVLWLIKKTFAHSPTTVLIKPSNFRHKMILAKFFNYATLMFIGVTCSALYSMMTSPIEHSLKSFITFIISGCIFTVFMALFSYFSINHVIEKNNFTNVNSD